MGRPGLEPQHVSGRSVRFRHLPLMDSEPDRRAGPASKTGGSSRSGDRDLRYPLATHGIGHHTVNNWRLHDTTSTIHRVADESAPSNTLGRESSATSSTCSGHGPTIRNPGRSARTTHRNTIRTRSGNDMESEPRRVLGTRWKRVGAARHGLRLLRFPPYVGTRRFRRRDNQESSSDPTGSGVVLPTDLAPERLMAGRLAFNQLPTGIAGSIPVWSSRPSRGQPFSGGVIGNTPGSEPVVGGSSPPWRALHPHPFRDRLTGKTLGFEPGRCAFESCSLSNYPKGGG